MTTEQTQKKILFAGLTILLCAGIFLYSASLFDRNVSDIAEIQTPASFQEQLEAVKNEKEKPVVAEVQPVKVTADWKTYKNAKYGLEFRYPKDFQVSDFGRQELGQKKDGKPVVFESLHVSPLSGDDGFLMHINVSLDKRLLDGPEDRMMGDEKSIDGTVFKGFSDPGMGDRSGYFAKVGSRYYILDAVFDDGRFDAILSTLKVAK
ncbi:MAG: hypothetical protein ACEQSB_04445 [Undibacterium sp.]